MFARVITPPTSITLRVLGMTSFALMSLWGQAAHAGVATIDFDRNDIHHGSVIANQYQDDYGVTIQANNYARHHNLAVAYDTRPDNPLNAGKPNWAYDRDLEGPSWGNSNLSQFGIDASQHQTGNALVIQENNWGCSDGICDYPDDEGHYYGGTLSFSFNDFSISDFGFDLVDIQCDEIFHSSVTFANAMESITYNFASFAYSPVHNAVFGDNSLNRILLSSIGIDADKVIFRIAGSGAIDNIRFTTDSSPATAVPEPATLGLSLLALGLFGLRQKKVGARYGR
ncbi:PEP-CTERM sorting domain-containing protein [Aestuariibacter sp. AA17]|uniref:PEP-CTERM sorting domain-containing protein n=1 Tax=Fluctibacter corallii TaxID=2984329 RepID=A0ABT3A491_9ALTE|nr:PEP-CTERM sorting domain-containing protein [Aestuariibacter sp. AA17]MCV2883459.1 PEP-CTERM sorting domain-containing protein [Aestuariibacter sp. AA17]